MKYSKRHFESTTGTGENEMEIAVLSDIHGNYVALERCLEYAFSQNIGTFILLGDYIGELAYPEKTMQILYDLIDMNVILSKEIKKIIGSIIELKGNKVGKTKILRRVHYYMHINRLKPEI